MEPGEEVEDEEEEEQRVPPIATTPPRRTWREESLSQSSSETQASAASGISLGEAIRQRTAAHQEIDSWYQLPAEVDASRLTAASETKLGLASDRNDLTEFPTLEEGVLPSAEASRRQHPEDTVHGLLLGMQDSQFSPCLPLLMYSTPGQRILDETLFQQSERDFIHLRGVPDVSGASEQHSNPLHIPEAAWLTDVETHSDAPSDCCSLSQHPLSFQQAEPSDANYLSQQTSRSSEPLMNKEASEDCKNDINERASIPRMGDKAVNQMEASLVKQTCGTSTEDDFFTCDNNVLAPVFELSEKEKELLRRDEFSSSESSSCKTALTKNSGKDEREMQMEKVKMAESESEGCLRHPERLEKVPELGSSQMLSDDLKKDSGKSSGAQDVFSAKTSEIAGESRGRRVDLSDFGSMNFVAVPNEVQGAFLNREEKQGLREEELSPIVPSTSDSAPKQPVVTNMESPPSCSENAQVELEPGVHKAELTISDVSIERGHKVTDISPSLNCIVDDGSFFRHFSHPSYQSTPGILLNKNVRAEVGARVIKSDVQASPLCLNEDNSGKSSTSTPTSVEKQRSLQCAQKENNKHLDSLKLRYPHTGRIQSLPSLNFMEKVGTWNLSQPENMPDVLALSDQGVISHRKKAYSAIASSANNILSMQNSSRNPEDYIAAPPGGTHSLENIHFHNKISEPVHPLPRSQSDNSVNVASRNNSQTDVVQPVSTEAMQPLEEKSNVSGVPENKLGSSLVHQLTAEIASGSVDKGSSVEQTSYPDAFISSERVARLIKEDGNSPTGDQEKCDGLENPKLPCNLDIGHVGVDNCGDISPDSLNLPAPSGESSHGALGSPGCSSVVSKHFFTSAEDDNLISVGATAVLETPEKEELNIEERIPIYLRNLGIDQSPGTILTPFVPRGPIREVEFSPSDLRTLKGSTDTLTRTIQQPRGELLAAVDVTQTSFNSGTSTVSISIPMNSETGSDTFSPRELSPCFSLPFGEKPVSQCTVSCHRVEVTAPRSMQVEAECSAVSKLAEPSQHLQTVSLDCHSNRESPVLVAKSVQDLLAKKESKDVNGSSQRWTVSSLAGVKGEKERGSQTSSAGSEKNEGRESDSVIGSRALQEIRKLLAEAESIAGSWPDPVFSNASSRETESSPVQIEKEDGTKDSDLVKDSVPQFQKVVSWAESMKQSSLQEGSIPEPLDSCKDDLKWERSFDASLCSCEGVVEMTGEFRTGKSVARSEPEGCSSATTDRNQPAVVAVARSNASSELSTERPSELENPSPSEPRGSVINVPGSFQNELSKANVAVSTAGGIQQSSGSSSGDSLAARVKNLLGNPLMPAGSTADISGGFQSTMSKTSAAGSKAEGVQESDGSSSGDSLVARVKNLLGNPSETSGSTTNVPGGFQSMLSKRSAAGSKAGGVQESDGSSSADSLSARVKSLLRNGSSLVPATPILRSDDEEERKARAWVKLKLASRSEEAALDLNEEDRQRIEEIKAELLLSAKRSGQAKGTRSYISEAASLYSCNQEADKEHSRASSDKRFHSDSHTQALGTKEILEPSLQHVVPLYRAELSDCCLLKNTQLKSLSTAEPPTCRQHQAVASSHSGCVGLHLPLQKQQDTRVRSFTAASDAQTDKVPSPAQKKLSFPKCSEEMSKQITSITFSSRRRFQSPLTSVVLDGFFSGDDLDEIMPLETDSATAEEQSHGRKHWERSEICPPSSPALAGSPSDEIAFPADKDTIRDVSPDGSRDGAYQETDCLSDRESVAVYADERQTPSAKNLDALSQDVTELGRHGARLLGLDCDRKFSQGMKGLHEPHSISSYQQEKSSPTSHVQLCESFEGSDPATQADLPKDCGKLLEEEKSPSDAVPLIQKEGAGEQTGVSQHSSPEEILSTMSPSSPVKKVLSCVHITLSPKCSNSEPHRDLNTENETRLGDKLEVNSQPVPLKSPKTLLEAVPKLPTAELIPEDQRCSSFLVPSAEPCLVFSSVPSTAGRELPLHGSEELQAVNSGGCSLKNICNCTDPAKSRKSTSDATTQITESPGKTTFSAEIYVNSQDPESSAHQSSIQKAKELPQNTTSSLNRTSSFPRQGAGQPLLLPYKPSGSTEMYYVPYQKTAANISSLASEKSGSNDALPSGLPADMLGVQNDKPPGTTAIKHKEGVCCKRAKPKLAWAEEQITAQEGAPEGSHHLKSVNTTQSVFKSAQFYLHHPVPHSELSEDSSGVGHTGISSSTVLQNWRKARRQRRVLSAHRRKDGDREFFPLVAEADHSKNEDLNIHTTLSNETPREELLQRGGREAEQMAARSQTSHLCENVVKDLPVRQRTHCAGSLDELWVQFLERQKRYQQQDFRRKGELSLVERLDRLARVLQNPIRYTLTPAKSERNASEKPREVKEQEKTRVLEKSVPESTSEPHAARVKGRPRINCRERSFVELRKNRSSEKVTCHTNEISEHQQYLDTSSDTCSERRLSKELCTTISSTISESDALTQTDIETTTQTEVSSSVSTIDTARLVRAFGHRRVQLSPRLSQLYCTIHQQKSRSEKWEEEGSGVRGAEHPKVTSERHRKQKETQKALDQALTSSGSWGPSSALSNKRRARMLNKGIQAGDLEIVNGATKKNTRDVGVTFPTPRSIQSNQRPRDPWHRVDGIFGESDGMVTDHQAAGSKGKQKGQPGSFFMEKRTKRSRLHLPQQGISWFVQAEDLRFESRKENCSNSIPGPGSSWFEPFTTTKPWREPLREKNFQEQQCSKVTQLAAPERDAETRPIQPLVKLTLQEALAVHRPDFISRSGERVKHLKLLKEERRMQSVLQSEPEELFNPPEKRKGYRNASHVLADRGYLIKEKRRAIPKSEMVQRSKRIYEQLPEVQKKREEEKRKSEYNSYRLKAQLYKMKITNRVLGRKVPWN